MAVDEDSLLGAAAAVADDTTIIQSLNTSSFNSTLIMEPDLLVQNLWNSTAPTVRHIDASVQAVLTFTYLLGIGGNAAALVILGRNETLRNKRQTLMLRCLSCNDLLALMGSLVQMYLHLYLPRAWVVSRLFCGFRVFWRAFGLGSGCVALVMAVERWLALTHPFIYQKHVTYHRIQVSIFSLWGLVTVLVCLPFIGFGLYYDLSRPDRFKCSRYRFATQPQDVIYAYVIFGFGIFMCFCIVLCNLCVIHALRQMGQRSAARRISTRSISRDHSASRGSQGNHSRESGRQSSNQGTPQRNGLKTNRASSQSLRSSQTLQRTGSTSSQSYQEEISFAKLMAVLCILYVVCWLPQMISIPIGQRDTTRQDLLFFRLCDVLIALNFVLDPFIYVIVRAANGRGGCGGLLRSLFCCASCWSSKAKSSQVQNTTSSTLLAGMGIEAHCEGSRLQLQKKRIPLELRIFSAHHHHQSATTIV